jgi:hypothetical protein
MSLRGGRTRPVEITEPGHVCGIIASSLSR